MSIQNSALPLYRAIADTIQARIVSGQYKPGEKIPPIRQFAQELGYNKVTVHKAFELLKQAGVIENRVGSGSYVRFPEKIASLGSGYDFRSDYLDESLFPFRQAQSIFNQLFDLEQGNTLSPTPVEGDPELLALLGRRYQLPVERMLIISGAQQGLDLVSKVFSTPLGESMLFEDPTYPGAISLFKARHFVPLIEDGPDLRALDHQLTSRIRLFYTMPAVHNPTGHSYSLVKKEAVVQRARQHAFYLIEDDYLGDLQEQTPRLVDIDPQRTIFIKSLAQTTLAGIRLGFMVVPADLFHKFVHAKYSSDIGSVGLLQKMVREFIRQGGYADHLENVRRLVEERRTRLLEVMARYPFLTVGGGRAGYSLWVQDRGSHRPAHAPWCWGEEFSFSPAFKTWFRLAFMHMTPPAFEQALGYFKTLWDR